MLQMSVVAFVLLSSPALGAPQYPGGSPVLRGPETTTTPRAVKKGVLVEATFENVTPLEVKIATMLAPCSKDKTGWNVSTLPAGKSLNVDLKTAAGVCYIFSYRDPFTSPRNSGVTKGAETVALKRFEFPRISTPPPPPASSCGGPLFALTDQRGEVKPGAEPNRFEYRRTFFQVRDLSILPKIGSTPCVNEWWGDIPFDGQWRTCVAWGKPQCDWTEVQFQTVAESTQTDRDTLRIVGDICGHDEEGIFKSALLLDAVMSNGLNLKTAAVGDAEKAVNLAVNLCMVAYSWDTTLMVNPARTNVIVNVPCW